MQNVKFMIEFFSGSKNVSSVFQQADYVTFAVDNDLKTAPDYCIDILQIQKSDICMVPDFMWFSIPCTVLCRRAGRQHFSVSEPKYRQYYYQAQTPQAHEILLIIQKVIEIIN